MWRDRERGKIRKGKAKETGTCKRLKTGGRDTYAYVEMPLKRDKLFHLCHFPLCMFYEIYY